MSDAINIGYSAPDAITEPETWDEEYAGWLLGKYVIAGMTRLMPDGETLDNQIQYHGRIIRIERLAGVFILCEGVHAGKELCLPPQLSWFEPASPGEYRLRSSGETIVDPDVTTSWTITPPLKS